MLTIRQRLSYLFGSTKGLILVAVAMIGLETALFGMLSGPMAELGVRDWIVRSLGMQLLPAEREGRIIILYHTIAMGVIAIETYIITALLKMKTFLRTAVRTLITVGYLVAMISGMGFAYWGHNWALHGLYIAGLTLIFFAGVLLCIALWPWDRAYFVTTKAYAHTRNGVDLERVAFFTTALTTVISALFGAVPGAYFGNGFRVFLAENIIRLPEKTGFQYAVIGHLHIMLALIAIMLTLIIGRWLDFKGILHKIAMPLFILGTLVLNLGVWGVVTPLEPIAHMIIYVGATPAMLGALMLVIYGWDELIREGSQGFVKPNAIQKLRALLHDPLRFGPLWQMVFMNFTVSGVGIFVAVRLDEIFRQWPAREERLILTGHWHVLSGIIATIILLYYGDMIGLKGLVRRLYGWGVIVFSDLAFAAVTVYELKRLVVSESAQQSLVNTVLLLTDIGLGTVLVILALILVWRLLDLFRRQGRWAEEAQQSDPALEVKA
ncbi:hypothetical protein SE15_09275 [Thermanaerothrix daxensis]|uniref:Cytochrome oxidase subunit I profile domain-containing protein n=1 Tax=Thermanaerothrix daxensis TaxID=869279 RepID=A0A0P6YB30_9CHLR|nr:hypothetical protein [Thermanaerothrix daxensis]KPL82360.1 hypothetical protein SE15_09275 [Thermanaerothrix daxensis]